jgi:hypothetical protein
VKPAQFGSSQPCPDRLPLSSALALALGPASRHLALLLRYQPVLEAPEARGPPLVLQNSDGISRRQPRPDEALNLVDNELAPAPGCTLGCCWAPARLPLAL